MNLRLASLWRPDAVVHRLPYFVIGAGLLALKHSLDWAVAREFFARSWQPFNYFVLPSQTVGVLMLPEQDRVFFGTLLALALPFVVVGVLLTVQRLRAARLPIALVLFFFIPLVNIVLFLLLSTLPTRPEAAPDLPDFDNAGPAPRTRGEAGGLAFDYRQTEAWGRIRGAYRRITLDTVTGSAALALGVVVPATLAAVVLSTIVLQNYAWGLFVGTPFCMGLAVVVLFGLARPQGFWPCMFVCFLATSLAGLGMLVFAMEGAVCLIMAAPIGYVLAFLGGLVGYAIQIRPWAAQHGPLVLLLLLLTLPGLLAAETVVPEEPDLLEVTSSVDVNAPPERVWNEVIAFPDLTAPDDWVFSTGVAYPVRAEIVGRGAGAERHCVFSTGTFVEPIDVWDEPRRLAFRVAAQPEPMREWSPYAIHPPHLDGYLVSRRGEFRLTELGGGRTRLEGTTWYTNRMWPAFYWRLWSDAIIHRIHLRVLNHIKGLAEAGGE